MPGGALVELRLESSILAVGQGEQAVLLRVRRLAVVRSHGVGIAPERAVAIASGKVLVRVVVFLGCNLQELKSVCILEMKLVQRKRGGWDQETPHHGDGLQNEKIGGFAD